MPPLSSHDILHIWELGQGRHPVDRALLCLAAVCPEMTREELAVLSIGQRDAHLLTLREQTFGATLNGFAECPQCVERLEFTLAAADLRVAAESGQDQKEFELVMEDLVLRFRLPDSVDLAAVATCKDADTARCLLVQRCVLQASHDGAPVTHSDLPTEVMNRLAMRMAECDPQAEVLLELDCPGCSHHWQLLFDILSFFWAEISAQAKRLLREVHTLARAYGWREADILSMSATRRRWYLEMVS
jgi:hypothetical protein